MMLTKHQSTSGYSLQAILPNTTLDWYRADKGQCNLPYLTANIALQGA